MSGRTKKIIDKALVEFKYYYHFFNNKRLVTRKGPQALIEKLYFSAFGKKPNLDNPITFNEKLQWLKLNYYDEKIPLCCNKKTVREYVAERGYEDLLIPCYGVYENPSQIDINALPNEFVLKPSHDSGHVIICENKETLNMKKTKKLLRRWLSVDYEFMSGEWPYQSKKYIVCEKLMKDEVNGELFDYKFFCFNGNPEYVFFCSDRKNHAKSDFYDMQWEKQDFRWLYEPSGKTFEKPANFEAMKNVARDLSHGFPFVRVDFYEINGKMYFGELTFYHGGGLGWFKPESIDTMMGEMITLPPKSTNNPWKVVHPELFERN